MKIGLFVYLADDRVENKKRSYESIRAVAKKADADGFDSLWVADHFLYRDPGEPTHGIWESWTILSALAEATEHVEIGPLVACNSFRNPAILAKMAETLDEVSNGRLILGIGAGWNEPEYEAFGLPFDHRASRFEEAIQIIKPLLRDGRVDFEGKYYRARDCEIAPRGPRQSGPPILIGGEGPRMRRLAARFGDYWNTGYMGTPDTLTAPRADFEEACRLEGRDLSTIGITVFICLWFPDLKPEKPRFCEAPLVGSTEEIAAAMAGYRDLGVEHIMFQIVPYTSESIARLTEALHIYRRNTDS
jgi:probable F420-dependent oxidoreductase